MPYAWLEQTRPGGIILTPLRTPLSEGALLRLTVSDDGTAAGRFLHGGSFMMLRSQWFNPPGEPDDFAERAVVSEPKFSPEDLLASDPAFTVGHLVPRCKVRYDRDDAGDVETVWLLAEDSSTTVCQYGARRLWDEAEAAYGWWREVGSPAPTRSGMTVVYGRRTLWLDDPNRIVTTIATSG